LSRLSSAAQAALQAYPWPGNVRQLQNVIFRAITMSDNLWLEVDDLDLVVSNSGIAMPGLARPGIAMPGQPTKQHTNQPAWPGAAELLQPALTPECNDWEQAVAQFERELLLRLYPHFPSSRKLAAQVNMSHTMMALKLKKYGITNPS
jgi:TyrR family helix-turn-helix protein